MQPLKSVSWAMFVVLALATAVCAQSPTPFYTVPLQATTTFTAASNANSGVALSGLTVASGGSVVAGDSVIGTPWQMSTASGTNYTGKNTSETMAISYGGSGYMMFQDAAGNGVGWHIKLAGWTVSKSGQGGFLTEIDLEAPYWLGDPNASVSPSLVQMMNAHSGVILLTMENPLHLNFNDLQSVGRNGKLGDVSSYSATTNGTLSLY